MELAIDRTGPSSLGTSHGWFTIPVARGNPRSVREGKTFTLWQLISNLRFLNLFADYVRDPTGVYLDETAV